VPSKGCLYRRNDTIGIGQNLIVPEPENAIALRLKPAGPYGVGLFRMLTAIRFHN